MSQVRALPPEPIYDVMADVTTRRGVLPQGAHLEFAAVAQSVERALGKGKVARSIRVSGTMKIIRL